MVAYDNQNIFARILRGELPCRKVYEDDHVLAFHDVHPRAPVHVLVIPRGPWQDIGHFHQSASAEEITGFWKGCIHVAGLLGLGHGYRVTSNCGPGGGQEVPHFHVHITGGPTPQK